MDCSIGFTYKEGKVDNLPVIVIDQDHTPTSSTVVDMLGDNKNDKSPPLCPRAAKTGR